MSFIVSFNGQFQRYTLPDLSHYDNVKGVYKSSTSHPLSTKEADGRQYEVGTKDNHANSSRSLAIKTYQNSEKKFNLDKKSILARDICSNPVHYLYVDQNYDDVLDLMEKYSCRHVPILDREEVLVGIISHTDMITRSAGSFISDIMTKEVLTALDYTRIEELAKIMLHKKFGALPIINDNHVLVGIVTLSDILYYVTTANKFSSSS
jgi:CBS domain-containing protein